MQRQIFGFLIGLSALVVSFSFPASAQPPDKPVIISAPEPRQPVAEAIPVFDPVEHEGQQMQEQAGTPAKTLHYFSDFYNLADAFAMSRLVDGPLWLERLMLVEANAKQDFKPHVELRDPTVIAHLVKIEKELAHEFSNLRDGFRINVKDVKVEEQGNEAAVSVQLTLTHRMGMRVSQVESVRMRREETPLGDVWKLMPNEPSISNSQNGFIQQLVNYIAYPEKMLMQLRAKESMEQVKQIGLGIKQFTQDHDEKMTFTPQTFKETLMPYLRSKEIFTAPNDEPDTQSYNLNPRLANLPLWEIPEPATTVTVYLGHDEKLNFRYDGKTVIGFADGHVELVDEEKAKTLRWKP